MPLSALVDQDRFCCVTNGSKVDISAVVIKSYHRPYRTHSSTWSGLARTNGDYELALSLAF